MALTGRERVLTALNHENPDRVPFDLGGTFVTTVNVAAYARLRHALGLPGKWRLLREQSQSVWVDEDVREALGVDTIGIFERAPYRQAEIPDARGELTSEWGVVYRKAEGLGGHYTLVTSPLRDAELADLDQYPWPDPLAAERFDGIAEEAAALRDGRHAVIGNLGWTEIFGMAWYLRGFETFMLDVAANKEMAHALLRRVADFQKMRYSRFLELAGQALDVVLFCDDMGGQQGLFISPRTYREMVKPYHAELLQSIRALTDARIMFHSCGSVVPLLDDFIEIGIDILNPVQVSAHGMDTGELKRRYGSRLSFWGAIDTQHVLPSGSPAGVRAEVRRRVLDLGGGGGYVVAPVHVVQADVPPENVVALREAVCRTAVG